MVKQSVTGIFIVLFAAGTLLFSGPATCSAGPADQTSPPWVWPLPPEKPRVQHLLSFVTPQDMGASKGFFARLWEFIAGEDTVDRVQSPHGIVSDGEGKVYVADWGAGLVHYFNFRKKKYDSFSRTKLGPLSSPIGLALDADGHLYVTDSYLRRVFVFKGTKNKLIIGDDTLQRPTGIAINKVLKRIYVVDTAGHRVDVFDLEGARLFSFGTRGEEVGEFNYPTHIALDQAGDVYVMDSLNFRVQIFDRDGRFQGLFGGNGTSIHDFVKPKGIAVDSERHIWVSDSLRNTIQIFDRQGNLLLIFGKLGVRTGEFNVPSGIWIDGQDRLFVADSYNYRVQMFQYIKQDNRD